MVIEFSVKNMVILDSGGNYLYVKESAQKLVHPTVSKGRTEGENKNPSPWLDCC